MTDKWWQEAMCKDADPRWFFPEGEQRNSYQLARQYCARCPVALQCLQDALSIPGTFGMWGGTTQNERERITDADKLAAKAAIGHGDKPGTITGYYREKNAGLIPCDECKTAYNAHQEAKRKAAA